MAKQHRPASSTGTELVQIPTMQRATQRAADFFSVYANDAQIQTSAWDVRITLGELGDQTLVEGNPVAYNVLQTGEIRISIPLAKKIAAIMEQQLRVYEERFGPIPRIPD